MYSIVAHYILNQQIGKEMGYLSVLLREVIRNYVSLRLKTYGKKYSEIIVHRNQPSLWHELTETILLRNQ